MLVATWTWYFQHIAPHVGPTSHTSFGWGLLHGAFALPNLIYILFDRRASIYQAPNIWRDYYFGFVLGLIFVYFILPTFYVKRRTRVRLIRR